jgi:hypothetical protein
MRKFLSLLAIAAIVGFAYALGARAGHGRFEEIRDAVSSAWDGPKKKRARKRARKQATPTRRAIAKRAKKRA